jgi:hypothetical protein
MSKDKFRSLLEEERDKRAQKGVDENGEPLKIWTDEDIDRLVRLAERKKLVYDEPQTDASRYLSEDSYDEYEIDEDDVVVYESNSVKTTDIAEDSDSSPTPDRIRSIMNDEAKPQKKKSADISFNLRGASERLSEKTRSLISKLKGAVDSLRCDENPKERRYEPDDERDEFDDEFYYDDDDFYDDEEPEEDVKIADFGKKSTEASDEEIEADKAGRTRPVTFDKPGRVIKKGISKQDSDLEGAPVIIPVEDDYSEDEGESDEYRKSILEAEENGQITMPGFGDVVSHDDPETVEESEAEKELFERRKAKINNFVLFGEDEEGSDGADSEKSRIGDIFANRDERPRRKETSEFIGVEYSQTKDDRRVRRYLLTQKKKSSVRVIIQAVLLVLAFVVSIEAVARTTVAGDSIITIFFNLVIGIASLITSNQVIFNSIENLKKKKFDINSAVSVVSVLTLLQTVLMFVLYFFDKNTVSVFAAAGVFPLLMSEVTSYVTFCRTVDSLDMCTGGNKDKLYNVEGIADDKDATELGKNVDSPSPRIRYSGKIRFPSHLIEICTGETRTDKNMRFIFLLITVMSVINFIVTGIVNRDVAVGFASLTVTYAMCVPAYAALLVQLPLRWTNKSFNKIGGMISSQNAVSELCRTNAIILDSKDLFDQNLCEMQGFKNFKNVRLDDAMLYAAAMAIRSGGPLTGVFDKMFVNRRDILPTVKSFSYEERLGVSGWINNQKVLLGTRDMMINHNVYVPDEIEDAKYIVEGHETIYLAIANTLAAFMVVDYAANMKLVPYLKRLRDSGVTILVRNCDPNVTEHMISQCFRLRLDNVKILSSASGRVFEKYRSRPKLNSRAVAIHDGTMYTFMRCLCLADTLRHVFRVSNTLMLIGMLMCFAIVFVLALIKVMADLPTIFILLIQLMMAGLFIGITKIISSK